MRSFEEGIYEDTLFKSWLSATPSDRSYQVILAQLAFLQPSLFSNCTLFFFMVLLLPKTLYFIYI